MANENDDLRQAMSRIQHIADSWRTSTAPNSPISGLDYDELSKFVATIPMRLINLENKNIIEQSNEIISCLPPLEFQDALADRETIVINSRLLLLKDAINDLTRAARRNGFHDPETQVLNVSGPEATELLQALKDDLAKVRSAINDINQGLAKKNVDPGISIGIPGVSVNLSKALSFIDDQTKEAREYIEASSQINIAALRRRLNKIASESTTISSFIKEKIILFGSKMAAAAKRLDLLAHQALSNGLKLAKSMLEFGQPRFNEEPDRSSQFESTGAEYIYRNFRRELSIQGIPAQSIYEVDDIQIRQRKALEYSTDYRYWLTLKVKYRVALAIDSLLGKKTAEISFPLEPRIISVFAAYTPETVTKFVKEAISSMGQAD